MDLCISTLSSLPDLHKKSLAEALRYTISVTKAEVKASTGNVSGLECGNKFQLRAVKDCLELLNETSDELKTVLDEMAGQCGPARNYTNMLTFLSGAMTNQYTCLDGFDVGSNKTVRRPIEASLVNITRHISNSLAMLKKMHGLPGPSDCMQEMTSSNDDLGEANRMGRAGFPAWMKRKDRRLLQAAGPPGSGLGTQVDLVVAKDGSGNFTTIGEAVAIAPNKSTTRFVIYIKAGAYFENVEVVKKKTNIMFLGDGLGRPLSRHCYQ
ncbi:Pectinesterase 3 [Bienertia sinuspersici]